ncbi:MAG: FecR domain-containing protein [Bacteroidota bacterium]
MNIPAHDIDHGLLMSYLLGEADDMQVAMVEEWLAQSDGHASYLAQLEKVWAESGRLDPVPVAVDTDAAWKIVRSNIAAGQQEILPKIRSVGWYIIRVAAVILLLAAFFLVLDYTGNGKDRVTVSALADVTSANLPDGSVVLLNNEAVIRYDADFSGDTREIDLEGQAFFDVSRDESKPFIIHAGGATVEVLGTSFSVDAAENSEITTVFVESGKVKFYPVSRGDSDTAMLVLGPGEKGIFNRKSGSMEKLTPDFSDDLFWANGTLVFDDADISKVLEVLRLHYRADISLLNEKINDCRLTATFINDPIDVVLGVIAESFGLTLSRQDNLWVLNGEGC